MICINCGHDNIAGVDLCDACGSDLAGHDLPEAKPGFRGRLLTGHVGDLPLAPAVRATPDDTVETAVEAMRQARHGCALVEEDGELVGIFTERDVLVRVLRAGLEPTAVRVGEVMTPEPLVLEHHDPPAWAVYRMVAQSFRHAPVLERGKLKGFVSVRSILRFLEDEITGT